MSLYAELKRRNVFKVTAAYLIVGWLILQIGEVLAPALRLPEWVNSALAFFIILGFPLAIVFAWAFEMTPEGLKLQKEIDRDKSITHLTGRKLDFWIIGLLAVALVFFAFDRFVLEPDRVAEQIASAVQEARQELPAEASNAAGEALAPDQKSIAVLPFVNMSNDPDQEFFSDGISEELLNVLARYPRLRVAARTSSFQFKGLNLDIADIARKLRVNHVLEGSVRKAGDRIRITAQLIEAESGYHLWSDTYDRELDDVFAIQDEISAAIGEALKITLALDGEPASAPTVAEAASINAYEDYMAGRQLINQRGRANVERAVVLLEAAVGEDSNYAPAQAQLAIAYLLMSNTAGAYGDWPHPEARARAMPCIERALALNESLSEAHGALALAGIMEPDYAAAMRHAERALQFNPSYADAINWLSLAAINRGRYNESIVALERLLDVDPLSVPGRVNMAVTRSRTGHIEAGIGLADEVGEQSPSTRFTARGIIAHDSQGDLVGASEWFLRLYGINPGDTFANRYLAYIFGKLDLMSEALRLRDDLWFYAYRGNRNWRQATVELQESLDIDPGDMRRRIYLASALLFAGEQEQSRALFEELLSSQADTALRDPLWYSPFPTLHAAWLRRQNGDEQGAQELMALARADLRAHEEAGRAFDWNDRSAALLAAMEGDDTAALGHMETAFERGHRDLSLFAEPALAGIADDPAFIDLEQRMTADIAKQKDSVLQLICFDNPAPEQWRPLPETCAGTEPDA